MSQLALVRPPSPRLAEGLLTHMERTGVTVAVLEATSMTLAGLGAARRAMGDA